ncbi:CRPV-336 [Crowpox virus]|nr:CRPV-336 [Crowpox virus]
MDYKILKRVPTSLIVLVICTYINVSFSCKRSILDNKGNISINICPFTSQECISWMYIERMFLKQHDFVTLGMFMYPSTYHNSKPDELMNFTLSKIYLTRWSKGNLYQISIGIKKTCNKKRLSLQDKASQGGQDSFQEIETIHIDDSLFVKEQDFVKNLVSETDSSQEYDNTTSVIIEHTNNTIKNFFHYYKVYNYIVIPICTLLILIIVTYITCNNKTCFFKKYIDKIDDIEDFILIKLYQEKEPLFHDIEGIDVDSEDDY